MDILLTHGYYLYADAHEKEVMRPYPPLGILYIAAHLREQGFDVELFDTTFSSMDAFAAAIAEKKPAIVGIYCNMMTRRNVVKMIPICKAQGAIVVLGGPDPANYPENYLTHGADIVAIGEGEGTLSELIPHLAQHGLNQLESVHGIVYREGEAAFCRTDARAYLNDLDAQPNPARDLIDIPQYMDIWKTNHGQSSVSLITARGCPYKCKWCSHAVFGYTHRRRSPAHVVDEVEQIKATYNPDLLWYADDVFTINHRWLYAYAQELTRRGLNTPFETISREDRLNEEVVKTLAGMGCFRIWIGAESGSQRILDAMERRTNVERVIDMVHLLQKYGIQAGMFIMLGYKDEEEADLIATVDTLKRANPDVFLTTVAYPIAGTKYYAEVADNVIPLKAWADGSDADYTVAGRHSRQYYRHATRWMVGAVDLNRQQKQSKPSYKQMAKAYFNKQLGRMGMRLTQHQVESGL